MSRRGKILAGAKLQVLIVSLIGVGCACATTVDFADRGEYPDGLAIANHTSWAGASGEAFVAQGKGALVLPGAENAWRAWQHKQAMAAPKAGDAVTVSIDFDYEQVAKRTDREVIRVGVGNGSSSLMATFNRKGWGDYHSIGMEGYVAGTVFATDKVGFKKNTSVGTSDRLRLAMTLTRVEGGLWDMVVVLANIKPNATWSTQWRKGGLSFSSGNSEALFGII